MFYDYTKIFARLDKYKGFSNYKLIYSRSEENEELSIKALENGFTVSVVFLNKNLPTTWNGFKVINGDLSDLEILNYPNETVVLGLIAKGHKARKNKSGFIVAN